VFAAVAVHQRLSHGQNGMEVPAAIRSLLITCV
jgi:hypothetical protein